MGLLSRQLGIRNFSLEDPAQPLLPPSALLESLGLGRSDAGVMMNERQAMRITTAYSCIKGISEDLASTAFEVIQEMPDDSMRVSKDHRLWPMLHDEWNPNMSSAVGRAAVVAQALGWGNGYAWIKRDGASRAIALIPLHPGKTAPVKVNGELMYATTQTDTGQALQIDPAHMLHIMGLSEDGIVGLSPIQSCKNAFGLTYAAEKFGAQFFGNGSQATGVFTHPAALEDEAYQNLKKSVWEWATGGQALRPLVLEEGMTWQPLTIPPDSAQFLQTRKFQKEEIAGLFRFPLHLVGSLERATNNNIEHQGLDYVRYCLRPWAIRLEQETRRKLLSGPFLAEHNFYDLQRGDFASQTAGFQVLRNIGVYSANRILRAMRQNPIPVAEGGDVLTVQGAMINLSSLIPGNEPDAPEAVAPDTVDGGGDQGDPAAKRRMVVAYRVLFRDAVGRVTNRAEREPEFVRRAFYPPVASMAEALLAMRFGNGTLTAKEGVLVGRVLTEIEAAAPAWEKQHAKAIAERVAGQVYDRLAKEIL